MTRKLEHMICHKNIDIVLCSIELSNRIQEVGYIFDTCKT